MRAVSAEYIKPQVRQIQIQVTEPDEDEEAVSGICATPRFKAV